MKSNAEKSLELIIQLEKHNEQYRNMSALIGKYIFDCIEAKSENYNADACLTEWLEKKIEIDYQNCPVTGREYEIKVPHWTAPQKTEKDCPHCYAALKLIEQRKELKLKRGRVRSQITKLAKREILNREL